MPGKWAETLPSGHGAVTRRHGLATKAPRQASVPAGRRFGPDGWRFDRTTDGWTLGKFPVTEAWNFPRSPGARGADGEECVDAQWCCADLGTLRVSIVVPALAASIRQRAPKSRAAPGPASRARARPSHGGSPAQPNAAGP